MEQVKSENRGQTKAYLRGLVWVDVCGDLVIMSHTVVHSTSQLVS